MQHKRLEDGTRYVGQLGELAYDPDEDKVQCHLCGGCTARSAAPTSAAQASVIALDASLGLW